MLGYRCDSVILGVFSHLNGSGTLCPKSSSCFPIPQWPGNALAVTGPAVPPASPAWDWCCFSSHGCCLTPAIPGAASLGLSHLHGFPAQPLPGALQSSGPVSPSWAVSLQGRQGLGHMGTFTCSPKEGCPPNLYQVSGRQRPAGLLKLRFNSIRVSVLCLPALWDGGCAPWDRFGGWGCVRA